MSGDSFLKRKVEKCAFSVPNREFILTYLTSRKKPASYKELAQELNVYSEDQLEGLHRRLQAMKRDGQLILIHQRYALPECMELLRGTVIGHRDGYGFLRVDGSKDDYYLSVEQMKMAIHGDVVMARAHGMNRKGRREARIIQILIPKTSQIVGRLFRDATSTFVIPDDSRLSFDILIPSESVQGSEKGYVVVELTQRQTRCTKATGKIVEVLGDNMDTNMVMNIALRTHEIPCIWPSEIKQQLTDFQEEIPEEVKCERVDLRALPLVTIDSEEACDFDDSVYCEKKSNGGWRLWVAISDVSYYVRPFTPLDQEARKRTTSVYFPTKMVIPMLPEVLSNGLCSLNPQVDRLCLVCEMTVSVQGCLSSYKFYEAVMSSQARLTYNKVFQIFQGNLDLYFQYSRLMKPLKQLHEMYQTLEKARLERGGIFFENEEAKFIFNSERRIEHIELVKRNDAHKVIEECMILANIAAARFVEKNKEPALYRVHDRPSSDHIISLRTVLSEFGLSLGGGDKPEPKDYANVINLASGRSDYETLQTMLLRSMKQAIYDSENRGHFGLALQTYTHFTSPIRRYPDLALHRIIKYLIGKQKGKVVDRATSTGGWHYDLEEILQLSQRCLIRERSVDEATRNVTDWLKCDFMQHHIGDVFRGIITNVTSFGFFVRLNELSIEGLVHIASLDNDYYRYNSTGQKLVGESRGRVYRLGDFVEIRVEAVHVNERKIDFSLTCCSSSCSSTIRGNKLLYQHQKNIS